ncbi:hypothetical protein EV191_102275 [Tamaricihabitans halophyticus]|uniref:Uncharacterized protein n=1 Tax=Tamaricihabitans halophyticus TaxID=1262583 RepID=A0A4R2QY08_9PSEU|nr:hypothetical protein [Tamaricihabitans halophyticus]TCP55063.1 hypothetical protein EV191_102275 [Tamaricihabitans halophyticus]
MSPPSAIYSTNFAETLSVAMNDFHEALTKRWREKYVEVVAGGEYSYDYPTVIQRPTSPTALTLWNAHATAARHHLVNGDCQYVQWVEGGQQGSLSAVTCPGNTGVNEPTDVLGTPADGGEMVTVPPQIRCGMGDNLKLIDEWAYGERDNVYFKMPLFDTHDLRALKDAYDDLVKIGGDLGLNQPVKDGKFDGVSEDDLSNQVTVLGDERGQGQDFWAGWTGLAASRAKEGFFASVLPSMTNQSGIAGSLANLYATRAAIIQKARNDTLYWSQWATKACSAEATVKTDLREGWAVVSGIGAAVGVYSSFTGVGAAAGATISLVGFLGEKLLPEVKQQEYTHEIEEIVNTLNSQIDGLGRKLSDMESEYSAKVTELQNGLNGVHSYNLELYDLTKNNAQGDRGGDDKGYEAEIEDILQISKVCYNVGEQYDALAPKVDDTEDADKSLADQDGKATTADTALQQLRDQFSGFLSTSTGRYVLAAQQVEAAAEDYAATDDGRQHAFDRIMGDWEDAGVGDIDVRGNPEDDARATDRGGGKPGKGDGEEYE